MMVYCCDRSIRLPRRKKRAFVLKNSTVIKPPPYRAPDHSEIKSVFMKRIERALDNEAADRILAEML